MPAPFPPELQDFIARQIASVEHLEVLLLLGRSPDRVWSVPELVRELRGNEASVTHWLNRLVTGQLALAVERGYRFQSTSAESQRLTELLAVAYRERPVHIIELIYSRPHTQLLDFSQAFKLRNRP